jgi:hypothetical protein
MRTNAAATFTLDDFGQELSRFRRDLGANRSISEKLLAKPLQGEAIIHIEPRWKFMDV